MVKQATFGAAGGPRDPEHMHRGDNWIEKNNQPYSPSLHDLWRMLGFFVSLPFAQVEWTEGRVGVALSAGVTVSFLDQILHGYHEVFKGV